METGNKITDLTNFDTKLRSINVILKENKTSPYRMLTSDTETIT